jgi:hypothetical protein
MTIAKWIRDGVTELIPPDIVVVGPVLRRRGNYSRASFIPPSQFHSSEFRDRRTVSESEAQPSFWRRYV